METIDKLTKLPTTDDYILSKIKTNIIQYHQLSNYKNIDDMFINDSAIILYENNFNTFY